METEGSAQTYRSSNPKVLVQDAQRENRKVFVGRFWGQLFPSRFLSEFRIRRLSLKLLRPIPLPSAGLFKLRNRCWFSKLRQSYVRTQRNFALGRRLTKPLPEGVQTASV